MFLTNFNDFHIWHHNWHLYVWTSLCQVSFCECPPESSCFTFWHLTSFWQFDILLTFWHLFDSLTHDLLLKLPQLVTELYFDTLTHDFLLEPSQPCEVLFLYFFSNWENRRWTTKLYCTRWFSVQIFEKTWCDKL